MNLSRRNFVLSGMAGMAATSAFANAPPQIKGSANTTRLAQEIVHLYRQLPGKTALKIWAPPRHGRPAFLAAAEPDTVLFCGSAFKAYVLAEFLRQMESGETRLDELLDVNDSVWSLSSMVLTPPPDGGVTGKITARTALDAMIAKSDNTATDMLLARVGADRVRQFLAEQSLTHSRIPDSTRQFFGYVIGSPEWRNLTWKQLQDLEQHSTFPQRPLINDVQTMAASPDDFVSFYARALQGEFFQSSDTLSLFRSILALSESIPRVMPLGVNAFMKGGSIKLPPDYALCLAGGLYIPGYGWVYFGMMLNWTDADAPNASDVINNFANTARQIFTWMHKALKTGNIK